jgi:hypothetical protein
VRRFTKSSQSLGLLLPLSSPHPPASPSPSHRYHAQLRALNELDVAVPPEVAAAAARGSGAGGNVAPAPWSPWPWGGEARVDVAASELGELEREMLKR